MKTKSLLLSILLLASPLVASCSTPSDSSTSEVTTLTISGPKFVDVGMTIKLQANMEVSWSTQDEKIARVDQTGMVTGVNTGKTKIIAVAQKDSSLRAEYEISVNANVDQVSVELDGEGITKDDSGVYTLLYGKAVTVTLSGVDSSAETSFSLAFDNNDESGMVDLVKDSSSQATLTPHGTVSSASLIIKVTANGNTKTLVVYFNVKDPNKDSMEALRTRIENSQASESSSLIKAAINREVKVDNESTESLASFNLYKNGTYLSIASGGQYTYLYSGIRDEIFYLFSYNKDEKNSINNIYANTSLSGLDDISDYETKAASMFMINDSVATYSLGSIILNYFDSSLFLADGFLNFGDANLYANIQVESGDSQVKVSSSYSTYHASLTVDFAGEKITRYVFEETNGSNSYKESLTTEYGDKKEESPSDEGYLSFDGYYFTAASNLDLVDLSGSKDDNGKWDYSNLSKYGAETKTTDEKGITTFRLPYNKSLPLEVEGVSGDARIDKISVTSKALPLDSNDTKPAGLKVPAVTDVGTYVFSANDGVVDGVHTMVPSKAQLTFTTNKNHISKTIIIEFYKPSIKSITASGPAVNAGNSFGDAFQGKVSDNYIYLNADLDDSSIQFEVVNEQGTAKIDGLEIYNYPDDNPLGYASSMYFVKPSKALKAGEYRFKFRAVGTDIVTEDTYTVTVKENLSAAEIAAGLKGKTYRNGDPNNASYDLTFGDDGNLTLNYKLYGTNPSATNSIKKVPYKVSDGSISIGDGKTDIELSQSSDFTFGKIKAGDILFDENLSSITLFLTYLYRADDGQYTDDGKFVAVKFSLVESSSSDDIDYSKLPEYLDGKSFKTEGFISSFTIPGMADISVNFTKNTGKIVVERRSDKSVITIDFKYSYDPKSHQFTLSEVDTTNENLKLASIEASNDNLQIKLISGEISSLFKISLK